MTQVEIIKPNLITEKNNTKNNNSRKKVCAYARVSTDLEDQLTSYNSQIEYYTKIIKSNSEWEFVGIYADEGISGTQIKNRVEFQRMINDALNGKIDIIITKSISRFARNTIDTLNTVRLLREHNVDVFFEKENIHTIMLDSEMFLTLYSAFAQAESESTSSNVKMGIRAKMKRGEIVGFPKCYGYNWNKETKELEIIPEEAEIIRMIFNWYAKGIGTRTIANKLNDKGIKSPKGNKYIAETILSYITNEKYVGDLLQNKTYTISPITHKKTVNYGEQEKYYVKDHHTPIISRDLWDKCQEILSKRRKKIIPNGQSHNEKYSRTYPFSSKIKCGMCGKNYVRRVGRKQKNGKRNSYWKCGDRCDVSSKCPNSITIRENVLEEIFVQVYNTIIKKKHKTKDKLFNAIREILNKEDNKNKINDLYQERKLLQKRLSTLIDMKLDNIDNQDIYIDKEKELNSNIMKLNKEIEELEKDTNDKRNYLKQLDDISKIISENEKPIDTFDEALFENIVDTIVIGEVDSNNNINPNVIRLFLKTGEEYKKDLVNNEESIESVSFVEHKRNRIFINNR